MPRKASDSMNGKMQSAQDGLMGDVCTILRVTTITGTYSDDEFTISTGTLQASCGFYFTNGQIRQAGQVLLVDHDVVLRLPVTTPVYLTDQIVLVEKGTVTVSGTFKPTEMPEIGATAQTVHLKRTT